MFVCMYDMPTTCPINHMTTCACKISFLLIILSLSKYCIDAVMVNIEDLHYIILVEPSLSNKLFSSFH